MTALPTEAQGREAFQRGSDDAQAGVDRRSAPWSPTAASLAERCLAAAYQRGYGVGVQLELQRRFGDAPTA